MHFGIFLNEYRYYFRGYARGWYVGGNAGMMAFRMSKPYIENWGIHLENRYSKGYGFMFGACAGYERIFRKRWGLRRVFRLVVDDELLQRLRPRRPHADGAAPPRTTAAPRSLQRFVGVGIPTRSASRSASVSTIPSCTGSEAKPDVCARRPAAPHRTGKRRPPTAVPECRVPYRPRPEACQNDSPDLPKRAPRLPKSVWHINCWNPPPKTEKRIGAAMRPYGCRPEPQQREFFNECQTKNS